MGLATVEVVAMRHDEKGFRTLTQLTLPVYCVCVSLALG